MPSIGGPCFTNDPIEVGEAGVVEDHPRPERRQRGRGDLQGARVPIDAEQPQVGVCGEQGGGVPTSAHGGVENDAWGDGGKQFDDLGGHDRLVFGIPVHLQPPDRPGAIGEFPLATDGEEGGGGVFHRAGRGAAHVPDASSVL